MTAADLIALAREEAHILAAAESCTGGLLGAALTAVPGSSDVFDRSFVTYSNAAKREMLGVKAETLAVHGAVSEPVAQEMAEGAFHASHATIAVSITGIAGPGGSENKPEGRVCFGLRWAKGARCETIEFGAIGRENVRQRSVAHALRMVYVCIKHDVHENYATRRESAQSLGTS